MPTYDYLCTSCSHAWELEQRIVEPPAKRCPACGADTAKRQISSGAGFILKGGGWYADGYGSKKTSSGEAKPGEKGGEAKPDEKGAKTDTKTEKKTEPAKPDGSKPEGSKNSSSEPKVSAA